MTCILQSSSTRLSYLWFHLKINLGEENEMRVKAKHHNRTAWADITAQRRAKQLPRLIQEDELRGAPGEAVPGTSTYLAPAQIPQENVSGTNSLSAQKDMHALMGSF